MSDGDRTRQRLIDLYTKKAGRHDLLAPLSPVPGYPERAQRRRAVAALGLRPGDTVVELACGTGRNLDFVEQAVGPEGRIVGVDLTDAMLARARLRTERRGWRNVELVLGDAAAFVYPERVDAILCTYALTQMPACADVVARGAAALSRAGHLVALDLQLPAAAPPLLTRVGARAVRPFASIDDWLARRPWEAIRAAMQDAFDEVSWTELCLRTAFLAVGTGRRAGSA